MTVALMSTQSFAQDVAVNQFFDAYEDRESVTFVNLSGKAFDMVSEMKTTEGDDIGFNRIAGQIEGLRMLIDNNDPYAKNTANRARNMLSSQFEDLVTIRDKKADIKIAINEAQGIVSEFIIIVGADSNFALISITGNMKLSDVNDVTKRLSTMKTDIFAKTIDPSKILVFPSPAKQGDEISVILPAELSGAKVEIFDVSGKMVSEFYAKDSAKKLNTGTFGSGVFILKATTGEVEATRKFLINP